GAIPSSVTSLHLGNQFNQPITQRTIPSSVTKLWLGDSFNQVLKKGSLPPSITYLDIGASYSKPLQVGCLPPKLEEFLLLPSTTCNHAIPLGLLPPTVTKLFMNNNTGSLPLGVIPNSVKTLFLRFLTDVRASSVHLPSSITDLRLIYREGYTGVQEWITIPPSVRTLNIIIHQKISPGSIPSSVTMLGLPCIFNSAIAPNTFPDSVTILKFGELFNQPLKPGALPSKIKKLSFRNTRAFNQLLTPKNVPASISSLTVWQARSKPLRHIGELINSTNIFTLKIISHLVQCPIVSDINNHQTINLTWKLGYVRIVFPPVRTSKFDDDVDDDDLYEDPCLQQPSPKYFLDTYRAYDLCYYLDMAENVTFEFRISPSNEYRIDCKQIDTQTVLVYCFQTSFFGFISITSLKNRMRHLII
ncbi:hypothetical protein SAMD00019534_034600, partial [Acytostelium subglobosum LB1]|uniref:hypothetical protein n=1 Tax=Acytostelium subglobosum LB1 TaxID=1410327 RepID=UPI000644B4CE